MFWIDKWYIILVIPAMLLGFWAQHRVNSTYRKYSGLYNSRGMSAAQAARQILDDNGLYDVDVVRTSGSLTDHYDPRERVVRLSDSTYGSASVAALGVAAHEVGHAVQHATGYFPLQLRNAIVPVTRIGSQISPFLLLIGLFLGWQPLVELGILLFALVALFQLITLPVEYNASRRALATLSNGMLTAEETNGAARVLDAAALTYVAALITSIAQLLRLILLYGGGRRRD